MDKLQSSVESWIRNQRSKIRVSWPQLRWPWNDGGPQRKQLQEEYQRRRKQLHSLCHAVKAESVSDLQDILCAMVLAECVYKKPAAEMLRAANKFKADFGGQVVSLERVQPSLDHVPHRYLLAEAGDTLYASFIGTKQYKDVIADANILQGAIFHEDFIEDIEENEVSEGDKISSQNVGKTLPDKPGQLKVKPKLDQVKNEPKPAAHRGFLARAKGIPALELYRLAQKKNRKLVLCGHSLGGAVAALATLAILRVIASSSQQKENEKVQVQCITFSQPPVGNAALKDYVHRKGWQHYFKTYCIPEDLVPRILSPAYFHHYNVQTSNDGENMSPSLMKHEDTSFKLRKSKPKENGSEQLVLGLGPVQKSFWRISRLVPLESVWKQLDRFKRRPGLTGRTSSILDSSLSTAFDEAEAEPQSLEIQEGSEGISLTPLGDKDRESTNGNSYTTGKGDNKNGDSGRWRRVPYLPSYVPFGQLYLLGSSSVELLSDSEYSKLTSVKSVLAELRERFQSHSMKSYRSRFQKIYELCMCVHPSPFSGIEQLPQFPHLQQWLGLAVAGTVELGHIVDPLVIRTATSVVPLGWSGALGEKNVEPLKVDITGYGLHLCSLVQAQVNGSWCSTTVESLPPAPNYSSDHVAEPNLQKMRIIIGRPLRRPPKHQMVADSFMGGFPSPDSDPINPAQEYKVGSCEEEDTYANGLHDFFICCTSDFITASKDVCVRTRRVRLVGLEGAGKTSLFNAILGHSRKSIALNLDIVHSENDKKQAGTSGGLCFLDTIGINLQELHSEVARFKDELWAGAHDLNKKIDLIILVHNLAHKIPVYHQPDASKMQPALSLLLDEAKALGIPWVLAITNKFSVSAHQQKSAISDVLNAYQALPSMTEVINSSPYVTPSSARSFDTWLANEKDPKGIMAAQKLILAPVNVVRMPFQKKSVVLPVEGVTSLCRLVHRVLKSHEEASFQELASERLRLELAREQAMVAEARQDSQGKANSLTAAAVGASLGAGLGLVLAVVMGAASALRKP